MRSGYWRKAGVCSNALAPAAEKGNACRREKKNGFRLARCPQCDTLYAIDCLDEAGLTALYGGSPSAEYWASVFMPAVAEARALNIFRPRARAVHDLVCQHAMPPARMIDVGAGNGVFLQEFAAIGSAMECCAVEPGEAASKACRALGFSTFQGFSAQAAQAEGWKGGFNLATSFEVIEHVPDPAQFLREMAALVCPGGLILATGLSGSGFDIVSLGLNAKAVAPPHHVNFLSRHGVSRLLARSGLTELAFVTPGKLDVEIVDKAFQADTNLISDPFLSRLLRHGGAEQKAMFQSFLSQAGLSSHMWILARKER